MKPHNATWGWQLVFKSVRVYEECVFVCVCVCVCFVEIILEAWAVSSVPALDGSGSGSGSWHSLLANAELRGAPVNDS